MPVSAIVSAYRAPESSSARLITGQQPQVIARRCHAGSAVLHVLCLPSAAAETAPLLTGARRTTLGTFVRGALEAAVSRLHVPEVAVGSIQLQGATVDAHVHGEELPRRFQDVSVVSWLH